MATPPALHSRIESEESHQRKREFFNRIGGKGTLPCYPERVKQSPEYLRNQSRYVHTIYRRNRRFLNWSAALLCAFGVSLLTASTLDILLKLGWGLDTEDLWGGAAFAVFGGLFWLFGRLVLSIVVGISRRIYGPDPDATE